MKKYEILLTGLISQFCSEHVKHFTISLFEPLTHIRARSVSTLLRFLTVSCYADGAA